MGTLSGCRGYQVLENFGVRHYQVLSERLGLTVSCLPSDTTFRRILHQLDFHLLAQQFHEWTSSTCAPQIGEWMAIDGKSIKGTVREPQTAYQNFVSLVSVYSSQAGVVLATQQFKQKKTSELTVVQTVFEVLDLAGVVFTLDALHCQKNDTSNY